eukprot:COSAG01_NODE_1731_length_9369_cov_35.048220_9_plen_87_part_00
MPQRSQRHIDAGGAVAWGGGGGVGAGRYDFNEPERVPAALVGRCDFIMVDPPYLNADAVAKFARTIRCARALSQPRRYFLIRTDVT